MKASSTPCTKDYNDSLRSVREALDILGGKWKIPIILSLAAGDKRFVEIKHHITGITSKVLSRELKVLKMNNLVARNVNSDSTVARYSITHKGKSLEKVIEGLKEWGDYHRTTTFNRTIHTNSISWFSEGSGDKKEKQHPAVKL